MWVDTSTGGYHLFWGWPYRDVHWSSVPIEPPSLGQVPMLAVDKRDRLHLVWQCPELGRDLWAPPEICYRKRTESGKWSMWRENISNSPDADSRRPQIAIADDIPFVVWQETVADDEEIYASRRIDGDWTPADNVSSTHGRSKAPAMAVDVTGSVHVAWDEEESTDLVFTRTWLVSNEDWREHDTVSNGGSRVRDVAIAASSTSTKVYLVWSETGPSEKWDIYFSEFDSLPHHFYLALISR